MDTNTIKPPEGFELDAQPTPPEGFDLDVQSPVETQLPDTPAQAAERAGIAFDLATEHNIPIDSAQRLVAGPEPSAFGKYIRQIKDYLNEKVGWFEPPIYGREYPEEHPVKRMGQGIAFAAAEVTSGLSLTAADVLTNKVTGDKNLAELVNRLTGLETTDKDKRAGLAVRYAAAFTPVSLGVNAVTKSIPAAKALMTILNAGLTFATTDAAIQFGRSITEDIPVDWKQVHLAGGVGVLFGMGEVALAAAMTGLAKGVEKYWGEKGIELASKIRPPGTSLKDQVAMQEAEIVKDISRAKEVFRKTGKMPADLMEKYVYGKPAEGSSLVEKVVEKAAEVVKKPATTAIPTPVAAKTGGITKNAAQSTLKNAAGQAEAITAPTAGGEIVVKDYVKNILEQPDIYEGGMVEGIDYLSEDEKKLLTPKQMQRFKDFVSSIRTSEDSYTISDMYNFGKKTFRVYEQGEEKVAEAAINYVFTNPKATTKLALSSAATDIEGQAVTQTPEEKRLSSGQESEQDLKAGIASPQETPRPSPRNKGVALIPPQVEESISCLERGVEAVKGLPSAIDYGIKGAADFIEKTYKIPEGKQLAKSVRDISFNANRRKATQWRKIQKEAGLDTLTKEQKLELVRFGQGRIKAADVSPEVLKISDSVRTVWDEDLDAANLAGYKRKVGGEWKSLIRTERWMPQLLNKEGQRVVNLARNKGIGNPKVAAACDAMVSMGSASSPEDALAKLLKYREISLMSSSLRGMDGNLESTRVLLPEYMVEFDPDIILPKVLDTNAKMIAAAQEWNVSAENPDLAGTANFSKLEPILGEIRTRYGSGDAEALRKWVGTTFGRSNDIPSSIETFLNFINNTETRLKLDYNLISALRNAFQGPGNLFTSSLLDTIKGLWKALEITPEGKEIAEMVRRSGAIHGVKEMGELVGGSEGETGMKPFMTAEHWSQKTAAIISLHKFRTNIQDLANYQEGSLLNKIIVHLKYLSANPEGYLSDMLKNRTFVNPITDEQLEELYTRPPTLDEAEQIAYRIVEDSQFVQTIASKPIPWNNPFFRVAMKFKTYAINQTRWVYTEAVKQALKGTFRPLVQFFLYSALIGELWNLTRDLVRGGDNSITSQLINREEKRNAKDLTASILNDILDGTGIGIIADVGYGLGSLATGPVGGTAKNLYEFGSNLRHPLTAAEKLARQEYTVLKDLGGLFNRLDAWFINQNNKYFDYVRARDRAFDFEAKDKKPSFTDKAWQTSKRVFLGKQDYPSNLPYEYAARQITVGDVQDAADYLADAIRTDSRDIKVIAASIESSMNTYSPLGRIADKNMKEFMSQFSPKEAAAMKKLQSDWIADYKKAIELAAKATGKPVKKSSGSKTFR